jgi:hypothetical protein
MSWSKTGYAIWRSWETRWTVAQRSDVTLKDLVQRRVNRAKDVLQRFLEIRKQIDPKDTLEECLCQVTD